MRNPEQSPSNLTTRPEARRGRTRTAIIGLGAASAVFLAGCGSEGDNSPDGAPLGSANIAEAPVFGDNAPVFEFIEFNASELGTDAERQEALEQTALHLAQEAVGYLAESGNVTIEEPDGDMPWVMSNYGGQGLVDLGPEDGTVVRATMREADESIDQPDPVLTFVVIYEPSLKNQADSIAMSFSVTVKGTLPPLPQTAGQLPAFADWLGSPAAAEACGPDYVGVTLAENRVRDVPQGDVGLGIDRNPDTAFGGVATVDLATLTSSPATAEGVAQGLNTAQAQLAELLGK